MGPWCTEQHGRTGLTRSCKNSILSVQDVEEAMLDFVKHYCPKGNGVSVSGGRGLAEFVQRMLVWGG